MAYLIRGYLHLNKHRFSDFICVSSIFVHESRYRDDGVVLLHTNQWYEHLRSENTYMYLLQR